MSSGSAINVSASTGVEPKGKYWSISPIGKAWPFKYLIATVSSREHSFYILDIFITKDIQLSSFFFCYLPFDHNSIALVPNTSP